MVARKVVENEERKLAILFRLHQRGVTPKNIAWRLGVTHQWVTRKLSDAGVPPKRPNCRPGKGDQASSLYNSSYQAPRVFRTCGKIGDLMESVDKAYQRVCG